MKTSRKHFVNFFSPGTFFSEQSTKPIKEWDTKTAVRMAKGITERYNAVPYGFQFTTCITADPIPDNEGGILKVSPREVERSGFYFIEGTLYSYDDIVLRNDPNDSILRSNMKINKCAIVIVNTNSWKTTMPFNKEDFIVDSVTGKITQRGDDDNLNTYREEFTVRMQADLNDFISGR